MKVPAYFWMVSGLIIGFAVSVAFRQSAEYKAAWKETFAAKPFLSRAGSNKRREMERQLDPWAGAN